MAAPGSPLNVAYGFEVSSTSVVTIASTSVGMIDGAITVRCPREVRPLRADQYAGPMDLTVVAKDAFVAFTMKEVLGGNLAHAWGAGTFAGSSVKVDATDEGQVALVIATTGPDGATATVTVGKAQSIGEGAWTIPFAEGQAITAEYQAVADMAASGLLLKVVHS